MSEEREFPPELQAGLDAILRGPPEYRDAALDSLASRHREFASELQGLKELYARVQPADKAPETIGPYRILGLLGEGGMGSVYVATQSQPVRRRVALKLIKLGMDSKSVVARFEQERQALALMQHDGIAKVFDCGTSERGQPYFVMEYVKGVPITRFCDQNRLDLPARLELFRQVCSAVQHAHQKGVVHRDLKPGNVLVTDESGKPEPKIIDFGLAKAMGQKLIEASVFTEVGRVVGTPEYMAPEQADPTNADIDTRADIYSLGVMLYELLVGQLPFAGHELRNGGQIGMQRLLWEVEPPKPSTRLASLGGASSSTAAARRMSVGALQRALKNDLDWVVLKCLEKDRNRRYDTAVGLAADLQRFLEHEPLVAGPPSAGYRIKKLLRRYRGQVLAASTVVVTAVGGAAVAIYYAREEKGARQESELRRIEAQANLDQFNLLANVVQLQDAKKIEETLYPAFPEKAAAMKEWLRDFGEPLQARLKTIEAALEAVRKKAKPRTPAEQKSQRETHPRFQELGSLEAELASCQRACDVRAKKAEVLLPDLDAATKAKSAMELNELAWPLVDPHKPVFGKESFALACARRALDRIESGDVSLEKHMLLDTLAWACYRVGLDQEAVQRSTEAKVQAPGDRAKEYEGYIANLVKEIGSWQGERGQQRLAGLKEQIRALDAEVSARREFTFAEGGDSFLHQTLSRLVTDLKAFLGKNGELLAVTKRLEEAELVEKRTIHEHRAEWDEAIVAIKASDDVKASKLYDHMVLKPQLGLVPLGMDKKSKLWEFGHLASGKPTKRHPRTGKLVIGEETGIVFVLLPGGTFRMGAQETDVPRPSLHEMPQREVTLAPFFMSKYEMTQWQWKMLSRGEEPSCYQASRNTGIDEPRGYRNPVEQVDWNQCDTLLTRHGLVLPTEAQWEYGCRAGTTTPWYSGANPATLDHHANVFDKRAAKVPNWDGQPENFDDGWAGPAPVGSYEPNAFGLHDVHGNVWEWCRDWAQPYDDHPGREGDGLRVGDPTGQRQRVLRGGSYRNTSRFVRSTHRYWTGSQVHDVIIGVRPARACTS